jgi:hypothetical protein
VNKRGGSIMRLSDRSIWGIVIGVLITPFTAGLAVASGGAGHGDYMFACILYPYAMVLGWLLPGSMTPVIILQSLLQFPIYGAIIGACRDKDRARLGAFVLFATHGVATGLVYLFLRSHRHDV